MTSEKIKAPGQNGSGSVGPKTAPTVGGTPAPMASTNVINITPGTTTPTPATPSTYQIPWHLMGNVPSFPSSLGSSSQSVRNVAIKQEPTVTVYHAPEPRSTTATQMSKPLPNSQTSTSWNFLDPRAPSVTTVGSVSAEAITVITPQSSLNWASGTTHSLQTAAATSTQRFSSSAQARPLAAGQATVPGQRAPDVRTNAALAPRQVIRLPNPPQTVPARTLNPAASLSYRGNSQLAARQQIVSSGHHEQVLNVRTNAVPGQVNRIPNSQQTTQTLNPSARLSNTANWQQIVARRVPGAAQVIQARAIVNPSTSLSQAANAPQNRQQIVVGAGAKRNPAPRQVAHLTNLPGTTAAQIPNPCAPLSFAANAPLNTTFNPLLSGSTTNSFPRQTMRASAPVQLQAPSLYGPPPPGGLNSPSFGAPGPIARPSSTNESQIRLVPNLTAPSATTGARRQAFLRADVPSTAWPAAREVVKIKEEVTVCVSVLKGR